LTVLVVDDDRKTVDLVRLYLERAGFEVQVGYDGRRALELAREQPPELVILDLMLPHVDGLDVCHVLHQEVGHVPIIMLSARSTEEDKLDGLETGADDYVTKPFSPRELVARVRAVLRRAEGSSGSRSSGRQSSAQQARMQLGALSIDALRREARVGGQAVHLTPREFRILHTLAREPERPFTRAELVERAFGFDYEGLERTVDAHIANLRKKIGSQFVVTVAGVGYKLAHAGSQLSA
jgi:two-component system, OmpR family, alkaline phosphatase synthesis response regulator PhoP